jgi:ABC-2 type transport system permease protein
MTTALRIFFIGGMTSYRALFHWLTPWILIPTFILGPLFELLFFAFVGKDAGVGSSTFYLIGNAVGAAAVPALFAMGNTVADERYSQTLGLLLASPARRLPLFLGRAVPVIINGFCVSVVALVLGALVLRVSLPPSTWGPLLLIIAITSMSCTGLGLTAAAIGLRVRETATLSNIILGTLIVFCGLYVAVSALPLWMQSVARFLPMSHGIAAAREVAGGAPLSSVLWLLRDEIALGLVYTAIGIGLLLFFERESRRHATLELA